MGIFSLMWKLEREKKKTGGRGNLMKIKENSRLEETEEGRKRRDMGIKIDPIKLFYCVHVCIYNGSHYYI